MDDGDADSDECLCKNGPSCDLNLLIHSRDVGHVRRNTRRELQQIRSNDHATVAVAFANRKGDGLLD